MSEKKSYLEKRVNPRKSVKVPVQFKLVKDKTELKKLKGHTALAKDLSLEGMYIKTEDTVKKGDVYRLEISIPEKPRRQLFAFAEVVWVKEKGAGLKLLLMPQEDRDDLKHYLERPSADK